MIITLHILKINRQNKPIHTAIYALAAYQHPTDGFKSPGVSIGNAVFIGDGRFLTATHAIRKEENVFELVSHFLYPCRNSGAELIIEGYIRCA
jgi:hypothetical protein